MKWLQFLGNWRFYAGVFFLMAFALLVLLGVNGRFSNANLLSFFPYANKQTPCTDFFLPEKVTKGADQLVIVLTQLANDRGLTQSSLLGSKLREFFGEELGSAIIFQSLDCTVFDQGTVAANQEKAVTDSAAALAMKIGADILIWGSLGENDQVGALNFNVTPNVERPNPSVESKAIGLKLDNESILGLAARLLTVGEQRGFVPSKYQISRMNRVLKITDPFLGQVTLDTASDGLAEIWLANGIANLWLSELSGAKPQLDQAIVSFRTAIKGLNRERGLHKWASAQYNLASALIKRELFEPDVAQVLEAVAAFRAALENFAPLESPFDLITIQTNLGDALFRLAELGGDTTALPNAIIAYGIALNEIDRRLNPLDWARVQNSLGIALSALGQRQSDITKLKEAEQAYRFALEEWKRDLVPMNWAMAQNNLGTVLQFIGLRETGTAKFEEAVLAFRATLEVWKRELVPLNWATAQNNLGTALQSIGFREGANGKAKELLEEAITSFRLALSERSKERVPFDWAATQNNLAVSLFRLSAIDADQAQAVSRLKEAATAYRATLEGWTKSRAPNEWASTQNDLGTVLKSLGERNNDLSMLMAATMAYNGALEVRQFETLPLQWATTQINLADALKALGERNSEQEQAIVQLGQAASAYRAATKAITQERLPFQWAITQINLGNTLKLLAERESQSSKAISNCEEAVLAYTKALEEITPKLSPQWHDLALKNRELCLAAPSNPLKP